MKKPILQAFRYYKLISEDVALLLESIANFNLKSDKNSAYLDNHRKIDKKLAFARSCYHHLAGYLGVKLTEYFINEKMIKSENKSFSLTEKGDAFFKRLSIDVKTFSDNKKPLLKPCLDFSERRYHMAGNLANLFLDYLLENRYLLRSNKEKRVLLLTDKGRVFLSKLENFSL